MGTTTKRQHYVWRGYLKRWNKEIDSLGRIYVYRKCVKGNQPKLENARLENVGFEKYYYDMTGFSKVDVGLVSEIIMKIQGQKEMTFGINKDLLESANEKRDFMEELICEYEEIDNKHHFLEKISQGDMNFYQDTTVQKVMNDLEREEYNEEMLILEQKREEKMQFIFKKTVFINLLYMTGKRYYVSEFFADLFWNTDKEYEKLDLIIEYEKEYIQCCRFYENSEKLNANRVAEDLIAKYKELGSKEPYTEYADTDPMKNFIRMRLSDVYFYKNMTCDKEQFNLQEMKESVELYETVIDNPSKIEFWDEKVDAYFCNSQGYTLRTMSKHEENEKKKLDYQNSALNKLSVAVSKQPNNGRYNRNLGLVYEDKGDLEKACERYKKAVQIDSFDYKAYNTVVSVELKRLEEEYGIKGRKEKLLNEIDFSNPKDWIEKIDNDILQCQKAEKLMFTFVDTHYNMAKAYMYKYLLEGKVKKELLKAAHNQIDIALELDPKSAGALYTKRNIYEAEGNYAEAKNCAENEVIAGKGDNKYLPSEYDKRMRMKLIAGK